MLGLGRASVQGIPVHRVWARFKVSPTSAAHSRGELRCTENSATCASHGPNGGRTERLAPTRQACQWCPAPRTVGALRQCLQAQGTEASQRVRPPLAPGSISRPRTPERLPANRGLTLRSRRTHAGKALGPRDAHGLCCASRPKRLAGAVRSAQTLAL